MSSMAEAPVAVGGPITIDVDGRAVTVEAETPRSWVRHPGDVIRLLVALLAVLGSWVVLEWGRRTAEGLQDDVSSATPDLPGLVLKIVYGAYGVVLVTLPVALLVWVISRRHWRLFLLYWATTATASIAVSLLSGIIDARVPTPPGTAGDLGGSLQIWELESYDAVASLAAALTVTGPWISRRWYRLGWIVLLMMLPVRLLVGAGVPTGRVFALALGWAIGSAALVIFGSPARAPSAQMIVRGLRSSGLWLTSLRRAGVDARGSTPYFAEAEDGSRYFVKTLGRDERSADLLFRVYRYLTLRNVGDEEPFSSLRRAVEHEAMASVWAERAGVRTPRTAACVELEDGSMALVYDLVKGRSIDRVEPAELTDEFLRGMWQQVALLRAGRIAHRDLRSANVFMTASGEPMMIDFGFGEVSASDQLLSQDVAQLIISTAIDVGAEPAVRAAVEVLGPKAVAAAAPRLQVPALSGATQTALKKHKGLLAEVQDQVREQTGVAEIELEKIQRFSGRHVLILVMAFGVLWFLIPQIAELPRLVTQLKDANWALAGLAVLFSLLTYFGSALSMTSSVAQRIPVIRATAVALAGSFVNRVSPAKVGGMALNLRFLQKSGVSTAVASTSIGLYSVVGAITHICLLIMFSIWAGRTVDLTEFLPGRTALLIGIGVVLGIIGALLFVPKLRGFIRQKVAPEAVKARANLRALLEHPIRLVLIVLGSAVLTLSYIAALEASLRAFGGQVALPVVAVIYLAGASVASAAPTPGGVGAVEAALIGGLTAAGAPSEVAVPGVFLYRLATFWIPVLPGWGAFSWLQRKEYI
jgi:undecaprenyl-diphosphatase